MSQSQSTNRFKQQNYSNQTNGYRNFNSDTRNQKEKYNRNDSSFRNRSDPPPKKQFSITENDFPDLAPSPALEKILDQTQKSTMDFRGITLLEKPVIKQKVDEVDPGWVRLSFENGKNYGNINWEYGADTGYDQYQEEQFALEANRVMNELVRRHENYKINYNNLFGEEAYEKLYGYCNSDYNDNETESEYYSSDDEQ
jgi:hypothetical protein